MRGQHDRQAGPRAALLGRCGAFRRSELCALEVAGLTEVPDGLRVLIRRSKGDQEGQGAEVAILRGCRLRPVEAVESWLAAGEISTGPVFRPVLKGQRVQAVALTPHSAAQIVKAYAKRAGLDAQGFAGHSCVATCDAPTCSRNTPGRRSCNCRGPNWRFGEANSPPGSIIAALSFSAPRLRLGVTRLH